MTCPGVGSDTESVTKQIFWKLRALRIVDTVSGWLRRGGGGGGGEGTVCRKSKGWGESLSQVCKISNDLYGGRQELPVLRQAGKLLSQAKVHQASIPGVKTEGTIIMRLH